MDNSDRGGIGSIAIGVLIIAVLAYFLVGDRIGLRESGTDISAPVQPPNVPATPPPAPQ